MVKMQALERFPYAGRTLEVGATFDASESDAHVLHLIGRADYAQVEPVAPPVAQQYQTRDMTAAPRSRRATRSAH